MANMHVTFTLLVLVLAHASARELQTDQTKPSTTSTKVAAASLEHVVAKSEPNGAVVGDNKNYPNDNGPGMDGPGVGAGADGWLGGEGGLGVGLGLGGLGGGQGSGLGTPGVGFRLPGGGLGISGGISGGAGVGAGVGARVGVGGGGGSNGIDDVNP